ncbi:NAD(+) kinase [Motilimonas eburnea]|uniref:NAD(+) kinase n=1 Tax=Motilimonas eburnea TaxID=1737488 RepID=UPI001E5D35B6|nr:NAD(+) kinase [Motilimonas eburnea]MCE2573376.1 NAD(+) kinase [Motilimonas eburnea]
MTAKFTSIGLIGKPNHLGANQTINALHHYLRQRNYRVIIETLVAAELDIEDVESMSVDELGHHVDLAIVVGGDGNMLGAARILSQHDVAVIGVNRGNLGFLTDLDPDAFEQPLEEVLAGNYQTEYRFLLEAEVIRKGAVHRRQTAVNEAILHPGKVAHMIEFEVYVNGSYMLHQRADGMIISTPTGSTAYSLSGGGPILTPNLDAITLVPMFPHTLSSRPIVLDANSHVRLVVAPHNVAEMQVSCDGHVILDVEPGDEVIIQKHKHKLKLVHPSSYSYFAVLQQKLGWEKKNF